MHSVGIDWAEEKHYVAVLNEEGKCVSEFVVQQNGKGFNLLQEQLARLTPVEINIERPDGLLVDWLVMQGYAVYVTPPRVVASHRPRSSKDDRNDARLLANLRRMQNEDCRLLARHSPIVQELLQRLRAFEQLQRQQLRATNQLRQVFKHYYPVMLHLFSDINTDIALAFVQAHPTPQAAQALTYDQLQAFLRGQGYNHMRQLDKLYQTLQTPMPTAAVSHGYQQHVQLLVPVIQLLNQQLTGIRRQISQTFMAHPEATWWRALPGAGELTAPRLLALVGDNRAVFSSCAALQALAGTVPVTRQSGKHKAVRFRWACVKALRKAIMDLARNSLAASGWARSYYYDQLERGHAEQRALRALANRWIRIIWTLWQRREPYDEARHVANRAHNGKAAGTLQVATAASR
jgi:transposase